MVEVADRFVTLSPPTDAPNDHLWFGYLYKAGLRHGPLDVHIPPRATRWFGTPEVRPPVTVEVFFQDGAVGTLTCPWLPASRVRLTHSRPSQTEPHSTSTRTRSESA